MLAGALLGLVALGVWRWRLAERPLDSLSTRLFPVRRPRNSRVEDTYRWLSDREMLKITTVSGRTTHLARFHIEQDIEEELPSLQKAVLSAGGGAWPLVSPDGRWVVCWRVDLTPPRRKERLCAISLDGSQIVLWPEVSGGIGDYLGHGWMPDSRTYFIVFVDKILLYRVSTPGKVERRRFPKISPDNRLLTALPDGPLLAGWNSSRQGFAMFQVQQVQIDAQPPTVRTANMRLPPGARVRQVQISPQGDLLAWHLLIDRPPPGSAWMEELLALLHTQPSSRHSLWVSRVDGSAMHEIGYVQDYDLSAIQWVPGSHRLTFLRHGYLCSVRIEE
jgi:hypothetical protein